MLATQPNEWKKLEQHHGAAVKEQFLKRLGSESTLRWNLREDRQDDKQITHAILKTIAAFLNTEGGDLLIGVSDGGTVIGIEADRLDNDDKFMLHLAQVVRNGLGDRPARASIPRRRLSTEKPCV